MEEPQTCSQGMYILLRLRVFPADAVGSVMCWREARGVCPESSSLKTGPARGTAQTPAVQSTQALKALGPGWGG